MQTLPATPAAEIERVAIQGELGSFSHEAALEFAPSAEIVPCAISSEVFRCLTAGEVDAAVIPIENSLAGSVLEHYDLLLAHDVLIEREQLLRVRHNLIGLPGATIEGMREVYSHPIALEQCRNFFRRHPHLRALPLYDTAGSVKHVRAGSSLAAGAVASRQAAEQYGGFLLAQGIEDNPENYTRFFLIRTAAANRARQELLPAVLHSKLGACPPTDVEEHASSPANKVSLCFAVQNSPGSLIAALEAFASQQINLTKLESRPVPGSPWQYIFYADYQMEEMGSADAALVELVEHCSMVKELGRYRAAVRV